MKTLFTVAALATLPLALAVSVGHARPCTGAFCGSNGASLNGILENGVWQNGSFYQGVNMQGTRVPGTAGEVTIGSTILVRVELPR